MIGSGSWSRRAARKKSYQMIFGHGPARWIIRSRITWDINWDINRNRIKSDVASI
uniref:Uncharacterized protein n=1 Tax=Setaria italica TaxID=4555 RepID=K3ZPB4_SETIT